MNIKGITVEGKEFFKIWLMLLKIYHNLTPSQIDVMALLLYKRFELLKVIKDEDLVDKILLSKVKSEIIEELNYGNTQMFNNMLTSLRKKKVIVKDNKIMKALIPIVEGGHFKLVFNFNIKWND